MNQHNQNQNKNKIFNHKNKLLKSYIDNTNENLYRYKDYSQFINTNIPINEEIYVKKKLIEKMLI